jgi:hypothetical protein
MTFKDNGKRDMMTGSLGLSAKMSTKIWKWNKKKFRRIVMRAKAYSI